MIGKMQKLCATMILVIVPMMFVPAFAIRGMGGYFWISPYQEFYCKSNLSNLNLTSSILSTCDTIEEAADRWSSLNSSAWSLTKATSHAINQRAVNMGTEGAVAEVVPTQIFGIMISAYVKYNTEVPFGDVDVDSNVYDLRTVTIHELGHLPTLLHNAHGGDSYSVIKSGLNLDEKRITITSNDEAAVEVKYP